MESTYEWPVMCIFDISFHWREMVETMHLWQFKVKKLSGGVGVGSVTPNELLYKQSRCQWFETAYVAHVTSL